MQRLIALATNQYFRYRREPQTNGYFVIGLWWNDNHAIFINVPLPYIQRSQLD